MKRIISLILTISTIISLSILPSYANNMVTPRWVTTSDTVVYHQRNADCAECMVYISGQPGARIIDVDIKMVAFLSNGPVTIASWDNLSGTDEFTFIEYVPLEMLDIVYQLSFTATVVRNGVTETISDYFDVLYT